MKKNRAKDFYEKKPINEEKSTIDVTSNFKSIAVEIVIFSLCIILAFFYNYLFTTRIVLTGKKYVELNYKTKYKEPGYKAYQINKRVDKNIKVTGSVNSKVLGTYKITYTTKKGLIKNTVERTVVVKDLEKPTIELTDGGNVYVCPEKEYEESGFTAKDNYDGDLTKKVKVKKTDDLITYTVIDSSNNKTVAIRKINYEDNEKPSITLNGNTNSFAFLGEKYNDVGATSTDNCDGDLTSKIKVNNKVNTDSAGVYKVIYTVSDKANNENTIERVVNVIERGKNGSIYLTFDDGPRNGTTNVILDILKEENVKATFFVTNSGPDDLIRREFDEGHTVGLHTSSHNYAYLYSSVDNYFNDLNAVSARVENITGTKSKVIRFPGGSSNTVSRKYAQGIMSTLTKEVLNRGYKYYDWNLASGDAGETTKSDVVYSNVISNLSHNRANMILMHDIKTYTRDALKRIIEYGKVNGYTFEAITENTEMITQRVNN